MREFACHPQPAALLTASNTLGVYAIVQWQIDAVELYYVAAVMYSCSSTATVASVTAPFYGAALPVISYSLSWDLVTPSSNIPPLLG